MRFEELGDTYLVPLQIIDALKGDFIIVRVPSKTRMFELKYSTRIEKKLRDRIKYGFINSSFCSVPCNVSLSRRIAIVGFD